MKIVIYILFLLLFSPVTFSKMIMTGTINGMKLSIARNVAANMDIDKYHFPLSQYEVESFFICNLKYTNDTPEIERKIDLAQFKCILADGKMYLMAYNEKSGVFEYKLFITPSTMNNNNMDVLRYFSVHGTITAYDGKEYLPVTGKVRFVDKRPALTNVTKMGSHYFSLAFDSKRSYNIRLTRLKEIPVTVEIDWFDHDIR